MAERDLSPTSTSSTQSNITVRTDKQVGARAMSSASPSISTPPTSLDDEASVLSETTRMEQAVQGHAETPAPQTTGDTPGSANTATSGAASGDIRRPARSSRKSVTTYNVQILAGTAIHTPTKYLQKHHKNVVHGSLESIIKKEKVTPGKKKMSRPKSEAAHISDPVEEQLVAEAAQAARRTSSRVTDLRKEVLRNLSGVGEAVASTFSEGMALIQGTLRRSASELHLNSGQSSSSASSLKRTRTAMEAEDGRQGTQLQEEKVYLKPKSKVWLKQGLYAGQDRDFDARLPDSQNRAKKRAKKPKGAGVLPLPIFACDRLLNEDPRHVFRDFKLPFDTYSPLPRKVKVDGWVKLNKNRFIGDASALWKRDKQDASQCYCNAEDGCGEACHNRIMAYECDDTNCRLRMDQCGNRPFAELKRRAKGNRYDYGVEVLDTEERGYGVRAMRTFEPNQIIVEYAGEIITQSECERRMKQVYKKDKCYYLMSFDNKMIIDATRGTIARFVNHSCEPNCEMIKWTVGGEPRMALFAGPRGIMTGEELTYDYNFDPFSQKNIQECRCGTETCRGVLGPKPKKPVEEKFVTSALITGTKRKLQDLLGSGRAGSESSHNSPKKRKMSIGASATTKSRNAFVESKSARERAEREATELLRQTSSRENRALKRSTPGILSKRMRSAKSQKTKTSSMKLARHTTVTFQRRVHKPGTSKISKKSSNTHTDLQRTNSTLHNKKGLRSSQRPATPIRETSTESSSSDEDASPNITPASLRSASRKRMQISPALPGPSEKYGLSNSDCERVYVSRTPSASGSKLQQRGSAPVRGTLGRPSADIATTYHPAQSRSRTVRGRFLPKGTI
ncbi:SET domain-containing protein [Clathrospora elynae]|uniref:SET domain-containing protein n=1 Tax=Clathrospora elynae TaxID=706981 RepID=A0A6A5T585_9PLEO|nr:SET domain-containing protein [Clathrospora elynae]